MQFLLLLIIFIIILFFIYLYQYNILTLRKITETWQDYTLNPYNYVLSGKDPLYFYRYDRFRRPYRDGFKFFQSYPTPHMSSFQ